VTRLLLALRRHSMAQFNVRFRALFGHQRVRLDITSLKSSLMPRAGGVQFTDVVERLTHFIYPV
jgi:hypothetical protein